MMTARPQPIMQLTVSLYVKKNHCDVHNIFVPSAVASHVCYVSWGLHSAVQQQGSLVFALISTH